MRSQTYEITFTGQAGATLCAEFDDCQVTIGPGTTTLRAELPDPAALAGLVLRITSLRLEVIHMHRVTPHKLMTEDAAIAADSNPVAWVGRQAAVTLPEHIDVSNAGQIREELLSLVNRGAAVLIADMTTTLSCDHAGIDAVVRAYQRALVSGTQLRLVVSAQIVQRVLLH